jgi:lysozyme
MAVEPLAQRPATPAGRWGLPAVLALLIALIGAFEGFNSHTYRDSVGVVTVCQGLTAADIPGLHMGQSFTDAQCSQMFERAIGKYAMAMEKPLKNPAALPDSSYAAFVSTTYNIGPGAWAHSSMVRDINAGNLRQACNDLLAYDHGTIRGKLVKIKGLTIRRIAERALCLKGT